MNPVVKLVLAKMSRDAIPDGGGVMDGVRFLVDRDKISSAAKSAGIWVENAISAVRNAAEPNPWKSSTDEEIAEEILRRMDNNERRAR